MSGEGTDSSLKPSSQMTPSNIITITRILLVPVFVAALLAPWPDWFGFDSPFSDNWKSIIAAGIFVVISGTDWLDGYLARSRNEITDFGKFMDPLADKILVSAALICLVELGDLPTWVVLIILAREFIVSGVRMMAAAKGQVIAASIVGKFKTVFQMIAIVLFTVKSSHMIGTLGDAVTDIFWDISWITMIIALGLTIASMLDYLYKARAILGFADDSEGASPRSAASIQDSARCLAHDVVTLATEGGTTVATAESLTGGMIGQTLTTVPGSSSVYKGGIVSYTNDVKERVLGVDGADLATFGAVSEPVALQMAEHARSSICSDVAVSVTGLAGPDADEYGNPVGTVFIAISTADGCTAHCKHFEGDRETIRLMTVEFALRLVLGFLSGEKTSN